MIEPVRGILLLIFATFAVPATAQDPLSASDWLSGSVRDPLRESSAWRPGDPRAPRPDTARRTIPPVAESGGVGAVAVSRLDKPDLDATGIRTAKDAGLPIDLWQGSDAARIVELIQASSVRLPAMNALLHRILLAQLTPPATTAKDRDQLFLARADRLLSIGDLAAARALLTVAGPATPEVFRRLFDIALLEGDESRACDLMNRTPGIAPSMAARIFCLAQSGDWPAAALSLHGAEALGLIEDDRLTLLQHYLDDSFVDGGEPLTPPDPVTPLDFRMHEAIGQPLPTAPLPVAFAHSDLRDNSGWKARIEAAERLARAGAISPARLRQVYLEQKPAASGGVWDRAAALQALDAALAAGTKGDALADALAAAFDTFAEAGMAGVLAAMTGDRLAAVAAQSPGGSLEATAGLLAAWQGAAPAAPGFPGEPVPEAAPPPPAPTDRKGEALLAAMADVDAGLDGDLTRAGRGLAMLRSLGLGADADLAAVQLRLAPLMMQGRGPGGN